MPSRLYVLSKLSAGERFLVEKLEAEIVAAPEKGPDHKLPSSIIESTAFALAELFEAAGWRASLRRGNGLVLRLVR